MVFNAKEYSHQYYLKNRERILAKTNAYNREHREEKRERDRIAYSNRKKEVVRIKIEPGLRINFS